MKQRTIRFCLLAVMGLAAIQQSAQAQMPAYDIVDLGTLGGNTSEAHGVNNLRQVVGDAYLSDHNRSHAFFYSNSKMQDLGNAFPNVPSNRDFGAAKAINDSGQIVGIAPTGSSTVPTSGFLYQNGTIQALPLLTAQDINLRGQIVGQNAQNHAALYQNGIVTDLGTLDPSPNASGTAYGINSQGQIVGESGHAFLYQNGVMQDLGTLSPQDASEAHAINDSGVIVGISYHDLSTGRAVYWQDGQIHNMGTLGGGSSYAININKYGVIVGTSDIPSNQLRPFVYQNGKMLDVFAGTSWFDGIAYDINDSGQIVGVGVSPSGYSRAFLATPRVANTPAPCSLLVCGLGVGLLGLRLRRKR